MIDAAAYELLTIGHEGGVTVATVDAPPMNVMTIPLLGELARLSHEIEHDADTRVLVLRSADPDFFIAHFDVAAILAMPGSTEPLDTPIEPSTELNGFHAMCERFRTGSTVTIAEIAGRVGGGGAELSASFDMRFGDVDRFVLNQMEVPLGILPGGSGTQRLPRLVGPGRAAEIVLGGVDVDGPTAADWGWLNRALPGDELRTHVDALASRIAGLPSDAVRLAKRSLLNAAGDPTPGLLAESDLFAQTLHTQDARDRMRRFLDEGGQTREVELRVAEVTTDWT